MKSFNLKTRGWRCDLRSTSAWYGDSCKIRAQITSRSAPCKGSAIQARSLPPMFTRHAGRFISHDDQSGWFGRDQLVPTTYTAPSIIKYCRGTTTSSLRPLVTNKVNDGIRETAVMVHRPPASRYSTRSAMTEDRRIGAARLWCPTDSTALRITPTSPPRSCHASADVSMSTSPVQVPEQCHDDSARRWRGKLNLIDNPDLKPVIKNPENVVTEANSAPER